MTSHYFLEVKDWLRDESYYTYVDYYANVVFSAGSVPNTANKYAKFPLGRYFYV